MTDYTDEKKSETTPVGNPASTRSLSTETLAGLFSFSALDEAACRKLILDALHPDGARCPDCGLALDNPASFMAGGRCVCGACGRWFEARTGTFLQGSQFEYRQVVLLAALAHFMEEGLDTTSVARYLNVSTDTVRIWLKRLKAVE